MEHEPPMETLVNENDMQDDMDNEFLTPEVYKYAQQGWEGLIGVYKQALYKISNRGGAIGNGGENNLKC